ncbi:tRNA (adenosine(37)-N6)-dimethylallyltransferase MiaA [bacterium]|nr:tRNA (adenosine(37)-N6)-dimethylallyltransferase MiaA [bacterium]
MIKSVKPVVIFITGPTASGKTGLSIMLAEKLKSQIVSADSRQVYKYMDIGTAKPTKKEMSGITHHCIDIRLPNEYFSAGEYQHTAREKIAEIVSQGMTPIVAGGSGLYISALADGIFSGNYRDENLRKQLQADADEKGLDFLYSQLCGIDPEAAEKIHANDEKRIIRALEVYMLAKMPISKLRQKNTNKGDFTPVFFALRWDRKKLYSRINLRTEKMISSGLVKEVEKLLSMGYTRELNSMDSVGYKEVFRYLDNELSMLEMEHLIQQNTRKYAKKQITWFGHDKRIEWIEVNEETSLEEITELILKKCFS